MKIFNGTFRGFECEFGIVDQTSGQMYISLSAKSPNAKKIINKLDEKTMRKVLSLPSNDGDGSNFSFAKFDDAVQWVFMFDRMSSNSQMGYIWYMGNQVEALYQYGFKKKIIKADKAEKGK